MSLDVWLTIKRDEPTEADKAIKLLRDNGFDDFADELCHHPHGDITVFDANYTHNCNAMACEAGIYDCVWRPGEHGITHARQIIEPLKAGIELMRSEPERFKAFNPKNGWGSYETFLPWLSHYLSACEEYPDAEVSVSR